MTIFGMWPHIVLILAELIAWPLTSVLTAQSISRSCHLNRYLRRAFCYALSILLFCTTWPTYLRFAIVHVLELRASCKMLWHYFMLPVLTLSFQHCVFSSTLFNRVVSLCRYAHKPQQTCSQVCSCVSVSRCCCVCCKMLRHYFMLPALTIHIEKWFWH